MSTTIFKYNKINDLRKCLQYHPMSNNIRRMLRQIKHRTPASLVCELLGVRAIARALDLSPGSVSKWQDSGLIPSKHHARILEVAKEKRKRLTPEMLIYGGGP